MTIPDSTVASAPNSDVPMSPIRWLWQANAAEAAQVGSKAARLAQLIQVGMPVPPGFCLTPDVYQQHLAQLEWQTLLKQRRFAELRQQLRQVRLQPALVAHVRTAYRQLAAEAPGAVAVRSSSTAEDLADTSFAGLYETVLGVADEAQLWDAIRHCWASFWQETAVTYRQQHQIDHAQHGMAVLVQTMVQPEIAGVLFTQSPLENGPAMLVEYVNGVADRLVDGEAQARREQLSREATQVAAAWRPLVQLGLEVERQTAVPQDIEWAKDRTGQLWILQTRPITTLKQETQPETAPVDVPEGWSLTYDEPFSPLGCDLAIRRYRYWVAAINSYFKTVFPAEMINVDGLLHYNPVWRTPRGSRRLWIWAWRGLRWLDAGRIRRDYARQILPSHHRQISRLQQQDVSRLDLPMLQAGFDAAVKAYLRYQYTSYPIGSVATLSAQFLEYACRRWFKGSSLNVLDLLSGLDDLSLQRELALNQLGQKLTGLLTAVEIENLDYATFLTLKERGKQGQQFWHAFQRFMAQYGFIWADRYPRDPAWSLSEPAMLASLRHAALKTDSERLSHRYGRQHQAREQAVAKARQQLSRQPWRVWRKPLFSLLLRRAETLFPYKENRNHFVYEAAMVIRRYARELGRRLQAQGTLAADTDVFFLTWDEIRAVLGDGERPSPPWQRLVVERRAVYERSRYLVQQRSSQNGHKVANRPAVAQLNGDACSPGIAAGPARLISGLGELQRVQPGEILVCTQLRPAWTSVFGRAGGVVIEMGSLLSHGSTLAREYGIPAVINIPNLTQLVQEDDWLVVDGIRGSVTVRHSE